MPQSPAFGYLKSPTGGPVPLAGNQDGTLPIAPASVLNIVGANAGVAVKTGAGLLRGISVNTAGTGSTLVVYDGINTSGTKLGTLSTTTQFSFDSLNWKFSTGLFVVTTGTVADVTVAYN